MFGNVDPVQIECFKYQENCERESESLLTELEAKRNQECAEKEEANELPSCIDIRRQAPSAVKLRLRRKRRTQ